MTGVILVYDGHCPMCSSFSQRLRLIKAAGEFELVDARSDHYLLPELKRRHIDLNVGMVLLVHDEIYQGVEAATVLAGMVGRWDFFNRCVYQIFSRKWLSVVVYPALKLLRSALLLFLWRKPLG